MNKYMLFNAIEHVIAADESTAMKKILALLEEARDIACGKIAETVEFRNSLNAACIDYASRCTTFAETDEYHRTGWRWKYRVSATVHAANAIRLARRGDADALKECMWCAHNLQAHKLAVELQRDMNGYDDDKFKPSAYQETGSFVLQLIAKEYGIHVAP